MKLKLKEWREKRGMSNKELSLASGVPRTQISKYECHDKLPNLTNFVKLCDALWVRFEDMIDEGEKVST